MIRKVGSQWILYSHTGRALGKFSSRAGALAREREINYFKHRQDAKEHTVNLLRARRALGLARRGRRLPRQIPPKTIERDYAAEILRVNARIREILAPIFAALPRLLESVGRDRTRTDVGEGKIIRELFEQARGRMRDAFTPRDIEALAERFARRTSTYNREQLGRQVRAALGADVFQADRRLPAIIEGFVSENVALIRGLPDRVLQDIEQTITRGVSNATTPGALAKELEERLGIGEDRAKLIARDQIGKIYGQINAERQRELGVDKFIWRTVNDERVRPEHEERDGNEYAYSDPPDGELPGEPINCRCYAEPVFSAILEEADEG